MGRKRGRKSTAPAATPEKEQSKIPSKATPAVPAPGAGKSKSNKKQSSAPAPTPAAAIPSSVNKSKKKKAKAVAATPASREDELSESIARTQALLASLESGERSLPSGDASMPLMVKPSAQQKKQKKKKTTQRGAGAGAGAGDASDSDDEDVAPSSGKKNKKKNKSAKGAAAKGAKAGAGAGAGAGVGPSDSESDSGVEDGYSGSDSDSGSDSESDGDEGEVDGAPKLAEPRAKAPKSATGTHKSMLAALQDVDPEFHEYLNKNDPSLLDFNESEGSDLSSDDDPDGLISNSDSDSDRPLTKAEKRKKDLEDKAGKTGIILSSRRLAKLEVDTFKKKDYRALIRLLAAFRSGCHVHDAEDKEKQAPASTRKYLIQSSRVHNRLLIDTMDNLHDILWFHLDVTTESGRTPGAISSAKRWPRLENHIKALLTSLCHFIGDLTEVSMLVYMLRALKPYIIFFNPFPRLCRKLLKMLMDIWGGTPHQGARLVSFLRIRQACGVLPDSTLENVLKGMYITYVKHSKFVSEQSAPSLALQGNCLVEIYGLSPSLSYQHGFVYLRELAVRLRTAITTKAKTAIQNIYSWQYVNCLKLWTAVLCAHGSDPSSELHQLVYPLVQVLIGVANLVPTARFLPLRFTVCSLLNELSWTTRIYIPVAPLMLTALTLCSSMSKPREKKAQKAPDFGLTLKLSSTALNSQTIQTAVVRRALDLLSDHLRSHFFSIAFPELAQPSIKQLKAFAKAVRPSQWRDGARSLVQSLQSQAEKVSTRRAALDASPRDTAVVAAFMAKEREASWQSRRDKRLQGVRDQEDKALEAATSMKRPPTAAIAGEEESDDGESDDDEGDVGLFGGDEGIFDDGSSSSDGGDDDEGDEEGGSGDDGSSMDGLEMEMED